MKTTLNTFMGFTIRDVMILSTANTKWRYHKKMHSLILPVLFPGEKSYERFSRVYYIQAMVEYIPFGTLYPLLNEEQKKEFAKILNETIQYKNLKDTLSEVKSVLNFSHVMSLLPSISFNEYPSVEECIQTIGRKQPWLQYKDREQYPVYQTYTTLQYKGKTILEHIIE